MKISKPGSSIARLLLCSVLILFISGLPFAHAKEKKRKVAGKDKPLHVVSDKMVAHKNGSVVEFIGNVKATREQDVILAQSIKVYLYPSDEKPDTGTGTDNVKKIVAAGDVEYTAGDRKAFADKAVYTTADETLLLTGKNARLLTGKSWITGNKITFFRKDGRAMVESDPNARVEAFFNPEDKPADQ